MRDTFTTHEILIIAFAVVGILGGYLIGVFQGKRYPLFPGEHLPYWLVGIGILLTLILLPIIGVVVLLTF